MDGSDQSSDPQAVEALDEFRVALIGVTDAMQGNVSRAGAMFRRVGQLEAAMDAGRPLIEVVRSEPRPLVVEMLTENITALQSAGLELRRRRPGRSMRTG